MASCQDEDAANGQEGEYSGQLTAHKGEMITRSVPPNSNFPVGTRYRLWAYNNAGYMFGSDNNGILASESSGHYIEMSQDYAPLLRTQFEVYGFTDNLSEKEGGTLEAGGNSNQPTYTITYDENIPEGYLDYMRGYLEYNNADPEKTSPVVEFKHILSRVRVQVIQQNKKNESGEDELDQNGNKVGLYNLYVHSASISDMYETEIYEVKSGTFTKADTEPKERALKIDIQGQEVLPAEASITPFSESYIFPTLDNEKDKAKTLKLKISGTDAWRFVQGGSATDNANEQREITIDITDQYAETDNTPLVFEQNYSYLLRVIFSKDGIVTFTPLAYPWFDGEINEEDEPYEEQPLGNTFLFNNLIWSDRNLGADHYEPTDAASYRKTTGFFYQFARNIPYFPMIEEETEDGSKRLVDHLEDLTVVYPVISNSVGRWHKPSGKTTDSSKPAGDEQANYNVNTYITELDNIDKEIEDGKKASYNYTQNAFGANASLWENVLTQPATPGWRIPTIDEMLSILPSCTYAGNITFLRSVAYTTDRGYAGTDRASSFSHFSDTPQDGSFEYNEYDNQGRAKDLNIIYCNVPTNSDYPNVPIGRTAEYDNKSNTNHLYDGSAPGVANTLSPTYDPEPGFSSEYLISKRYPDEFARPAKNIEVTVTNKTDYWGVIYGIKKVGTSEAYRMRWSIKNADPTNTENLYYLVIERFTATASDRLSYNKNDANYYRKYDWTRPVAVINIPIVGIIGDAGFNDSKDGVANAIQYRGRLGNFGTETLLATTSAGRSNLYYQVYHIKIHGTNRTNQYLFPAEERCGTGAQIRLVRESTYQPNR